MTELEEMEAAVEHLTKGMALVANFDGNWRTEQALKPLAKGLAWVLMVREIKRRER